MRRRNNYIFVILILVLFLTVGYAALASAFNLNSLIGLSRQSFDIHFENAILETSNATIVSGPTYMDSKHTEINFEVILNTLGSAVYLSADIVNSGTMAGEIEEIKLTGIPEELSEYVFVSAGYDDYTLVQVGDVVEPGSSVPFVLVVGYSMKFGKVEEIPDTSEPISFTYSIKYKNTKKSSSSVYAHLTEVTDPINDLIRINQNNIYSSDSIDFTRSYTGGTSGLFELKVENGVPIYYYRGSSDATNNYLITENICWRIIRTTETGGIKLLYNGYQYDGECDEYKPSSDTDVYAFDNNVDFYDSEIRSLLSGCDSDDPVIARGAPTASTKGVSGGNSSYVGEVCGILSSQYVEDYTYCNNYNFYRNNITDLSCEEGRGFSVSNGKLDYPIGLIDLPEANLCGYNAYQSSKSWLVDPYHYYSYWTMTANKNFNSNAIGLIGDISSDLPNGDVYYVYPVITLNSTFRIINGTGTMFDPYIVEGLEPSSGSGGGGGDI